MVAQQRLHSILVVLMSDSTVAAPLFQASALKTSRKTECAPQGKEKSPCVFLMGNERTCANIARAPRQAQTETQEIREGTNRAVYLPVVIRLSDYICSARAQDDEQFRARQLSCHSGACTELKLTFKVAPRNRIYVGNKDAETGCYCTS